MLERKTVKTYRKTLQELAKPQKETRRKTLEGKAAKLGIEIYGEERRAKPKTKLRGKPRR